MSGELGAAIRSARKSAGMTQMRLAELVGVSVPYLCDMERGKPVPLNRLFQIANQFPDADSAAWLWMRLADQWGQEIADVMRRHARASETTTAAECGAKQPTATQHTGDGDGGYL